MRPKQEILEEYIKEMNTTEWDRSTVVKTIALKREYSNNYVKPQDKCLECNDTPTIDCEFH